MSVLGMHCIKEDPVIATGIRGHVYDSDSVSAYPTATSVANVSKSTTKREMIRVVDVPEEVFRMQNINFTIGITNALEYSQCMFRLPSPTEALSMFKKR
jgi:predicted NUDIX family phosphoesterase